MKLFGQKSLSRLLFIISWFVSLGCLALLAFILLSILFGNFEVIDGQFRIALPFFKETFIKGFYESDILITISLVLLFSAVFSYLLSRIFKAFTSEVIFTTKSVQNLNRFAFLNLVIFPMLYLIIHFIIMQKGNFKDLPNLILCLLLGVFTLFIAAIFKRGLKVQNENDLTI